MGFPFTPAESMFDTHSEIYLLKINFSMPGENVPRHVTYWTPLMPSHGHHMASIAGQYVSAATKWLIYMIAYIFLSFEIKLIDLHQDAWTLF